jgi:arsenate reductase
VLPVSAERNPKPRIVFVCVENACRSQIAEAIARIHGADVIEAFSAGSYPCGEVIRRPPAALRERAYDLSAHRSKPLAALPDVVFDRIVTGDPCAREAARGIGDPGPEGREPRRLREDVRLSSHASSSCSVLCRASLQGMPVPQIEWRLSG